MAASPRHWHRERRTVCALALLIATWAGAPGARAQTCTGDCNQDQSTSGDELDLGIAIALGEASAASCPAFDGNDDASCASKKW